MSTNGGVLHMNLNGMLHAWLTRYSLHVHDAIEQSMRYSRECKRRSLVAEPLILTCRDGPAVKATNAYTDVSKRMARRWRAASNPLPARLANLLPARQVSNLLPPCLTNNVLPSRLANNVLPARMAQNLLPTRLTSNLMPIRLTSNLALMVELLSLNAGYSNWK